jgi:hypothetical protein
MLCRMAVTGYPTSAHPGNRPADDTSCQHITCGIDNYVALPAVRRSVQHRRVRESATKLPRSTRAKAKTHKLSVSWCAGARYTCTGQSQIGDRQKGDTGNRTWRGVRGAMQSGRLPGRRQPLLFLCCTSTDDIHRPRSVWNQLPAALATCWRGSATPEHLCRQQRWLTCLLRLPRAGASVMRGTRNAAARRSATRPRSRLPSAIQQ